MAQIIKIIVERGRTISKKNHQYEKLHYVIEAEVNEGDRIQEVRDNLTMLLKAWIDQDQREINKV